MAKEKLKWNIMNEITSIYIGIAPTIFGYAAFTLLLLLAFFACKLSKPEVKQ